MTSQSPLRTPLLALLLAAVLGIGAVACGSSDDDAAANTDDVTTTTAADNGDDNGDTTTTTEASGAPCTPEALALAGAASGPAGNFDTVENYGCEDGWAWAWLSDSSGQTTSLISEVFQDEGGEWSSTGSALCDGTAGSTAPVDILEKGCEYSGS